RFSQWADDCAMVSRLRVVGRRGSVGWARRAGVARGCTARDGAADKSGSCRAGRRTDLGYLALAALLGWDAGFSPELPDLRGEYHRTVSNTRVALWGDAEHSPVRTLSRRTEYDRGDGVPTTDGNRRRHWYGNCAAGSHRRARISVGDA